MTFNVLSIAIIKLVFNCHDGGMINNWRFVFTFCEKKYLDVS